VAVPNFLVRDIMTHLVVTAEPATLLLDAALAMRASSIRHLPVVEDGRLVGLLTDRDTQRCAPSRLIPISEEEYNAVFANTSVNRVMTRKPLSIAPDAPLLAAIESMQQTRYGCLPVVEGEQLVGILTRSDLVDVLQRVLSGGGTAPPTWASFMSVFLTSNPGRHGQLRQTITTNLVS
jgi:acetoin utilization protein AcuB